MSSLVLLLLVAATARSQSPLDPFLDRDLSKLSDKERVRLEKVVGAQSKSGDRHYPQHIFKIGTHSGIRYVLVLARDLVVIPGGSSATIELFDPSGRKLKEWRFGAGWRIDYRDASLEYAPHIGAHVVLFHVAPVINGRPVVREYFAISNDELKLVRLEGSRGQMVPNSYVASNFVIGLIPTAKTTNEWAALLKSSDPADVLSALVFLGGEHTVPWPPFPVESIHADLFLTLAKDKQIRDLVDGLCQSQNTWIFQAAVLAAREMERARAARQAR